MAFHLRKQEAKNRKIRIMRQSLTGNQMILQSLRRRIMHRKGYRTETLKKGRISHQISQVRMMPVPGLRLKIKTIYCGA